MNIMQGATHLSAAAVPFQEDWWLDAASSGRCEKLEVTWNGVTVAALPFMRVTRLGFRQLKMPPYTRTLGVRLFLPPSKPFKRSQNIRHIVDELVRRLPRHDSFHAALDPDDETPFGFALSGCSVSQTFTFQVPPSADLDTVWDECDQKTRNLIRTARRQLEVSENADFDRFQRVSLLDRPDARNIHDFPLLGRIFSACLQRRQGTILTAAGEDGRPVASVILVWGSRRMYFWVAARNRLAPGGGANALLLWKSLELARSMNLTLDFDGFSSGAAARFLASFGQAPVPRPEIISANWRYQVAQLGKRWLREVP